MKRFKKWMACIMAMAMLATCMAFATSEYSDHSSGRNTASGEADSVVSGAGNYLGNIAGVFKVTLPTSAAATKIAFTVDPKMLITNSPPDDVETGGSPNSTVIFRNTLSGDLATEATSGKAYYTNHSDPLYVTNRSSVDITVTMFATLSDTKMTFVTSGDGSFKADTGDPTKHLSLGVSVVTGDITADNAKTHTTSAFNSFKKITPLGFRATDDTKANGGNFKYVKSGNTTEYKTEEKAAADLSPWHELAYMVKGDANPNADWNIPGLSAPTLTMKWMVDPASDITYPLGDNAIFSGGSFKGQVREGVISGGKFEDTATASRTYDAITDKEAYQAGELVTVYVQPRLDGKKLKSVTFTYISEKDGKFEKSNALKATLVTASDGITPISANGVYSATFPYPSNVAKSTAKDGTTITSSTYLAPYFTIVVG